MKNSQPFMSACFKMLIRVAKQKTLDMAERYDLYNNSKRNLETQTAVEETKKKKVHVENTNIWVFPWKQ